MASDARDGVERRSQNIPVPLGGMSPVRAHRKSHVRVRRLLPAAALIVFVAAAAGGLLLVLPAEPSAGLDGNAVVAGGMTLKRVPSPPGVMLFSGDASLALSEQAGAVLVAAAWDGPAGAEAGRCTARTAGRLLVADCSFTDPTGRRTSCVDVLDPSRGPEWQRTYSDGRHVAIAVASGAAAIPLPFPVG